MLSRLRDFLESRAGLATLARKALDEPVPGGARFVYASASVLVLFLGLQALTGLVLAMHYSPSVATAWASLVYFEEKVHAGRFLRALHRYGAGAIVLCLAAHYSQVAWFGAYKKPREINWALGLLLVPVVLALAHTGYQLPWDQRGYWATRVATGIAGATPVVGGALQRLALGGEEPGNLSLTRFYAVHVLVLPALLVVLASAHLYVFRRNGVTPSPSVPDGAPGDRFFPGQVLRDLVAFLVAAGAFLAFVSSRGHAPLDAPGDPASDYQPRPEWYFLPLFELLKHFPSNLEYVGSLVVPGAIFLALLSLPWLDRGPSRAARERKAALAVAFAPLALALVLGALAAVADANDPDLAARRAEEARDARLARRLFRENGGVPPEGALVLLDRHPPRLGKRVFREQCASCHSVDGSPAGKGPDLTGYLSERWLVDVIRDPTSPRFFGQGGFPESMGKTAATPEELSAMALYCRSLGTQVPEDARLERGRRLFEERDCGTCHEVAPGTVSEEAPSLADYGSPEWLTAFLRAPGSQRFYGKRNRMPAYKGRLTPAELEAVVVYLRGLASPDPEEQ